ncbi:MAG: hypothetical protein ACXVY3_08095 [Gaiellaceae bacterium]
MRRLLPTDEHGNPNPDEIRPGDITIADYERLCKLFMALTDGIGDSPAASEQVRSLEEIEREIEELELRVFAKTEGA